MDLKLKLNKGCCSFPARKEQISCIASQQSSGLCVVSALCLSHFLNTRWRCKTSAGHHHHVSCFSVPLVCFHCCGDIGAAVILMSWCSSEEDMTGERVCVDALFFLSSSWKAAALQCGRSWFWQGCNSVMRQNHSKQRSLKALIFQFEVGSTVPPHVGSMDSLKASTVVWKNASRALKALLFYQV